MGAHMNNGQLGDVQILEPSICQSMHSRQLSFSRGAYDGFGLGWFLSADGLQGHSGSVPGYIANMRYNKTEQGSYGIILMLSRGYALGNDMSPVDNFYNPVNELLWQEAQRLFNTHPLTLNETLLIVGAATLPFAICLTAAVVTWQKRKHASSTRHAVRKIP
jgi:hypothetical protein